MADISAQSAATYELEAMRWASAGRPDHAVHLYSAALDLEPGRTRTRMQLAECLVRCNNPSAAASEYLRVAQDYLVLRRDREMLAICYRIFHLDPSQLVYVVVADMFRRIGREARPLCAATAEAHLASGRVSDGLHMLRLGAETDARNPDVRRSLAALYRSQHMISDAVVHLAEAGRLLLAAGNNAGYIEVAEEVLELDGRHLQTLQGLPCAYLRVGEPQRAVVKLADLMRVSPGNAIGYEILAHAFATIGRISTALSVLDRLSTELRTTGRVEAATDLLQRAQGWQIDDPEFAPSVLALGTPKATDEGTVILDIADLEIEDAEATVVLRLETTQVIELSDIEFAEDTQVQGLPDDRTALAFEGDGETLRLFGMPALLCTL